MLAAYALDVGRRVVALRSQLPLISTEAPTAWVHVAYEGEWHGHHAGSFSFDGETFAQIVANHERQANPVKLDFEHETEFAPPGQAVPARGWVHELKIETDAEGRAHLWALVEFGARAVEYNREGGYRFCSGVFEFEATDRVTGESIGCYLSSLALTDQPFVDGQRPILLSRRAALNTSGDERMKFSKEALARALEMIEEDDVSMEQLEAAAQMAAASEGGMEPEEAPAEEPEAPEAPMMDEEPEEEEQPLSADAPPAMPAGEAAELMDGDEEPEEEEPDAMTAAVAPLLEAFNGDAAALAAALSENLDAALAALRGGADEPAAEAPLSDAEVGVALTASKRMVSVLSAKVDELEAWKTAREEEDADRDVGVLVSEGRITDDVRDDWKAIRLSSKARFDKLAAALVSVVPVGKHALSTTPPTEQTPVVEIDENDPLVLSLRRTLRNAGIVGDHQNDVIRRRLAARTTNQARA